MTIHLFTLFVVVVGRQWCGGYRFFGRTKTPSNGRGTIVAGFHSTCPVDDFPTNSNVRVRANIATNTLSSNNARLTPKQYLCICRTSETKIGYTSKVRAKLDEKNEKPNTTTLRNRSALDSETTDNPAIRLHTHTHMNVTTTLYIPWTSTKG